MRAERRTGLLRIAFGLGLGLALLAPAAAQAEPLKLSQIYELSVYVQCVEAAPQLSRSPSFEERDALHGYLAGCGRPSRLWEKNGVHPVDRRDLELAILEAHDPEEHLIPRIIASVLDGVVLHVYGDDYPTPDGTCTRD